MISKWLYLLVTKNTRDFIVDYNYENLLVAPNLCELKKLLEENEFLVTAYIDLDDESFLRDIRAFIYVGAHGYYNFGVYDY